MSCGVGGRCGLDPEAVAARHSRALIRSLAWEPPYAAGAALKNKQANKKTKAKAK